MDNEELYNKFVGAVTNPVLSDLEYDDVIYDIGCSRECSLEGDTGVDDVTIWDYEKIIENILDPVDDYKILNVWLEDGVMNFLAENKMDDVPRYNRMIYYKDIPIGEKAKMIMGYQNDRLNLYTTMYGADNIINNIINDDIYKHAGEMLMNLNSHEIYGPDTPILGDIKRRINHVHNLSDDFVLKFRKIINNIFNYYVFSLSVSYSDEQKKELIDWIKEHYPIYDMVRSYNGL